MLEFRRLKNLAFFLVAALAFYSSSETFAQKASSDFQLARAKYSGGGDWYNDQSGDVNMMKFLSANANVRTRPVFKYVDLSSDELFEYPIIWLTGHGNVNFTPDEARNLRIYLENGGFLYIDDDYGLDKYIRREMKKVFPEQDFVELPFSHGIYSAVYKFPNGLPKIHKHNGKPPQGFGLFSGGRLCAFYTYETNLGDGWTDPDVHKDPEEKRLEALKMGANIIVWALTH